MLLLVHTGVIPSVLQQEAILPNFPRTHGGYSIRVGAVLLPVHTGVIRSDAFHTSPCIYFLRTHGGYSYHKKFKNGGYAYSSYSRGLFVMDVLNAEFNPFSPYLRRLFWRVFQNPKIQGFSVHTGVIHIRVQNWIDRTCCPYT